ncbi:MAG: hypothetical protein KDA89_14975 [Planctomycetaceae bacterium]|nr:hypothetical protein [Planctomycetaceae bacterium]
MRRLSQLLTATSVVILAVPLLAADIRQVSHRCGTGDGCEGCNSEGCRNGDRCGKDRNNGRGRNGRCDGSCRGNGRMCNMRTTWNDLCLNWCGPCGPTGRLCRMGCPGARAACWCCNTKAFPDSGWAPPAHNPILRQGNVYQTFLPGQWYGAPGGGFSGGAPMVYQPTDTTQLGYSYGNVPTWRPNPGMIPPVPLPNNFHNRVCPCGPPCGGCNTCMAGGFPAMHGYSEGAFCPNGDCYGAVMESTPAMYPEMAGEQFTPALQDPNTHQVTPVSRSTASTDDAAVNGLRPVPEPIQQTRIDLSSEPAPVPPEIPAVPDMMIDLGGIPAPTPVTPPAPTGLANPATAAGTTGTVTKAKYPAQQPQQVRQTSAANAQEKKSAQPQPQSHSQSRRSNWQGLPKLESGDNGVR